MSERRKQPLRWGGGQGAGGHTGRGSNPCQELSMCKERKVTKREAWSDQGEGRQDIGSKN